VAAIDYLEQGGCRRIDCASSRHVSGTGVGTPCSAFSPQVLDITGVPKGIQTPVTAVKGHFSGQIAVR
jgi:hypothetical protein